MSLQNLVGVSLETIAPSKQTIRRLLEGASLAEPGGHPWSHPHVERARREQQRLQQAKLLRSLRECLLDLRLFHHQELGLAVAHGDSEVAFRRWGHVPLLLYVFIAGHGFGVRAVGGEVYLSSARFHARFERLQMLVQLGEHGRKHDQIKIGPESKRRPPPQGLSPSDRRPCLLSGMSGLEP